MKEKFTILEAARLLGIQEGSVKVAIYNQRLKAKKNGRYWVVLLSDLEEYKNTRWQRIFPPPKGEITVIDADQWRGQLQGQFQLHCIMDFYQNGHVQSMG